MCSSSHLLAVHFTLTVQHYSCYQLKHTHPFNGPLSGTTQVSQYQKGKTNLDVTEARDSEWQWHQLGHMQVCTSLQTNNHASTPPFSFYRPDALPAAQPTVSTAHTPSKCKHTFCHCLKSCCFQQALQST